MAIYKRGETWWYKFSFQGLSIRESAKTASRDLARRAERERRRQLEMGANRLEKVQKPMMLSAVIADWLDSHPHWSANSRRINRTNCAHLGPVLGRLLLNEIRADHIGRYQTARVKEGAAPKTVNLEVATLRQMLREEGHWGPLDGKVRMLPVHEQIGQALTGEQIARLFAAARQTRSRSLVVALLVYRYTGLRLSELRLMRWLQIDLIEGFLVTGRGKTRQGEGRKIPLAPTALAALRAWRALFPEAQPRHYVFPSERYGLAGEGGSVAGEVAVYAITPDKPIGSWKTAWTTCRAIAGVQCRIHDFRHTFVSDVMENPEVADSTAMALTGHVSKRMLEHYSHARMEAKRRAVAALEFPSVPARGWAQ